MSLRVGSPGLEDQRPLPWASSLRGLASRTFRHVTRKGWGVGRRPRAGGVPPRGWVACLRVGSWWPSSSRKPSWVLGTVLSPWTPEGSASGRVRCWEVSESAEARSLPLPLPPPGATLQNDRDPVNIRGPGLLGGIPMPGAHTGLSCLCLGPVG